MNYKFLFVIIAFLSLTLGLFWGIIGLPSKKILNIHLPKFGIQEYLSHFSGEKYSIPLFDPETAPAAIKSQVMLGYNIIMETQKHAKEYAGDSLNCRNCHFAAGDTLGGKNNGISLVGVPKVYPRTLEDGTKQSLEERINACFEKSMNGKPLPIDSPLMQAMMAYLDWISQGVPANASFEWLRLKPLKSDHKPDVHNGALVYNSKCAQCHGNDGQGTIIGEGLTIPPVWGDHSFNSAAGMNKLDKLSAFVYSNMPYDEPEPSMENSIDVAAFIISQPRPQKR